MKLFKNANLIDFEKETATLVDILVDDKGKIAKIESGIKCAGEVVDLCGDYVLPPFVNGFAQGRIAVKNSYGIETDEKLAEQLLLCKNLLAGAVFLNNNPLILDEIDKKSETELDILSEKAAKTKNTLFMKVGLDLDELGAIDKHYQKTLSQVLEDFGFLDRKSVLVGGNCLEKDELQLLKTYDTKVVLTPYEDGRLGRRQNNLRLLKNLGFEMCLGSGAMAEIDFFGFMRQILLDTNSLFENTGLLSEKDVLKIATNGNVLGFDNAVKVGFDANFVVIKKRESLYPNVFKELVWGKSKKDVKMTIFKGSFLQKNGEILMQSLPKYDKIKEEIRISQGEN